LAAAGVVVSLALRDLTAGDDGGLASVGGPVVDTVAAGVVACEMVICGHALSAAQGEGNDSGGGGGGAAGGGGDAAAAAAAAGGGCRGSGSDSAIGFLTLPERRALFADASTHRGKGRVNVSGGGLGRGRERYAGGGTQDVFPLGVLSSWRRCTVSVIVAHARWLKGTTLRCT